MGTKRSRHNKGRKPFFKYRRRDDSSKQFYFGMRVCALPSSTGRNPIAAAKLDVFEECLEKGESISAAAAAAEISRNSGTLYFKKLGFLKRLKPIKVPGKLGRLPIDEAKIAILRQFFKTGHSVTDSAAKVGIHRNTATRYIKDIRRSVVLPDSRNYPYIIATNNSDAELVLAVNKLVPRVYPSDIRADICQEMMLALLEGSVTISELQARQTQSAWFLRKFYKDNFEKQGRAISLDTKNEDWNSDSIASSVATKEWAREQFAERTRFTDSIKTFTPPTQIDDVWHNQIKRQQERLAAAGEYLEFDEVAQLLDTSATNIFRGENR